MTDAKCRELYFKNFELLSLQNNLIDGMWENFLLAWRLSRANIGWPSVDAMREKAKANCGVFETAQWLKSWVEGQNKNE